MNNIWQINPDDRLKEWRSFRKNLENGSDQNILQSVIDWWKMAPISARAIDIYDSSLWPDPWELLHNGEYDENSLALGMAYSLHLMNKPCKILLVQSRKESYLGLIVLVDETFVLNYTYGVVEDRNVLNDCQVLETWYTLELIS